MRELDVAKTFYWSTNRDGVYLNRQIDVRLYEINESELFLELKEYDSQRGRFTSATTIRLKSGLLDLESPSPRAMKDSSEGIADLLRKALDFKRDDSGLYVPKFKPGDVVLVDRPGSPEIRVLELEDQSYERVPKRAMTPMDRKVCSCPARELLAGAGCKCGGSA